MERSGEYQKFEKHNNKLALMLKYRILHPKVENTTVRKISCMIYNICKVKCMAIIIYNSGVGRFKYTIVRFLYSMWSANISLGGRL